MPDGIVRGLKKAEEEVVTTGRKVEHGIEEAGKAGLRGVLKAEEKVLEEAPKLARKAEEFGKKELEKIEYGAKGLAERAKKRVAEAIEQQRLAREYEREYIREPRAPLSPEEHEAKVKALLAPKRPLTELLGVKKEDGVYKQMELPCQQKFKCQNCEYYAECTSPQKVRKPKTEEEHIDEFFGGGWDDLGKGWERLG
jgi:hypothetical protein